MDCTCNSCLACTEALNDPYCSEVTLTQDINAGNYGTCIDNPSGFDNKIFNCQGYEISEGSVPTDYGIYLYGRSGNTIKDCKINGYSYGIYSSYSAYNNFVNILSDEFNIYLFYFDSSDYNNITNATARDGSFMYGIYLLSSSYNNIRNSYIEDTSYNGITLDSNCQYNNLENNVLFNNQQYGIFISSGYYNVLDGNNATSHYYDGIYMSSSFENVLQNNYAYSNMGNGINLYLCDNNNLTNNTANSNMGNGIHMALSTENILNGNTANSNMGSGVYLHFSTENTIENLNANSNQQNGISLESSGSNAIYNSNFNNNMGAGVYIYSGENNNFTNCTAINNNIGIQVEDTNNRFMQLTSKQNNADIVSTDGITLRLYSYLFSGASSSIYIPSVTIVGEQILQSNNKIILGNLFVSMNTTPGDPFNTTANVSIAVPSCSEPLSVYKSHGFPQSLEEILQNGYIYSPSWSQCVDNVFTFTVDSFSGYGINQTPPTIDSAMKKVQHLVYGDHSKITFTSEGDFITEGGNITQNNLTSNASTEKWAGIYGRIEGTMSLGKNTSTTTNTFYTWTISDVSGSKVCAQRDGSEFLWGSVTSASAVSADNVWSFTSGDIDSINSTYATTCSNFKIAGKTVGSTIGVSNIGNSANDFTNCAFTDGSASSKSHFAFCTIADTNGLVMDSFEADYALMLPTNEADGQTETYDIFVQLA